jgi:DNA-binding MarR family transcriptional regulator
LVERTVSAKNYSQTQASPLHLFLVPVSVPGLKPYVAPPGPPAIHRALLKHTGFLLARVGHVAAKQFSERIAQLGLTTRMWGALNVLDAEGETTQQFLGKCTGIDPSSMVATIDDLEARGLVERRPHPSDRRAHALHLTEQGREVLARGRRLARGAQEDLLAPLDNEQRKNLHDLLLRLAVASAPERSEPEREQKGSTP